MALENARLAEHQLEEAVWQARQRDDEQTGEIGKVFVRLDSWAGRREVACEFLKETPHRFLVRLGEDCLLPGGRHGISGPFLSDIELGRRFPSEEILGKLARALNVSLEELRQYDNREPIAKLSVFLDEWFECLSHYIGGHDADLKLPRMQTVDSCRMRS